jgi:putative colanic acid biosysnthesis UDP-glucose lipid carrier transferase
MAFVTANYQSPARLVLAMLHAVFAALIGYVLFREYVGQNGSLSLYKAGIVVGVVLLEPILTAVGVYRPGRRPGLMGTVRQIWWGATLWAVALVLLAFATKTGQQFSRVWAVLWTVGNVAALTAVQLGFHALSRWLNSRGIGMRRIVWIGDGLSIQPTIGRFRTDALRGYQFVAFFSDRPEDVIQVGERTCVGQPLCDDLGVVLADLKADEVWITLPLTDAGRLDEFLRMLRHSTANIRYIPSVTQSRLLNHSVSDVGGVTALDLSRSPLEGVNRMVKAAEDRLMALVILLLISPIIVLIAIAVKMSSPGPVFYRQERVSWNGRRFVMLKFRSMPHNIESGIGAVWATKGDQRATRLGSFLRRTSLDELPQFLNVLFGDMSIVGPRPERPVFVEKFKEEIPDYMKKHMVKAGITGWAQVNGWRGDTDLKKRIEHDLYYIENWSVPFDIKIILMTVFKGFIGPHAY